MNTGQAAMDDWKTDVETTLGKHSWDNLHKDLNRVLQREPTDEEMVIFSMGHINMLNPDSKFNKNFGGRQHMPQATPVDVERMAYNYSRRWYSKS